MKPYWFLAGLAVGITCFACDIQEEETDPLEPVGVVPGSGGSTSPGSTSPEDTGGSGGSTVVPPVEDASVPPPDAALLCDCNCPECPSCQQEAAAKPPMKYEVTKQSCMKLPITSCGTYSCCKALYVEGGCFEMGRGEGSDKYPGFADETPEHKAAVGSFFLDAYEVVVPRFRAFVEAFDGTPPPEGSGAHPLIPGSGWKSEWNHYLAPSGEELVKHLNCDKVPNPTSVWFNEHKSSSRLLPINCVSWYEAFAFCVWDGGRLPTEAEWEYAAAGGDENRLYAWGDADPDPTLASFECLFGGDRSACSLSDIAPVGSFPSGRGRWGHDDLSGNLGEWVLDLYAAKAYHRNDCTMCANLTEGDARTIRGGAWNGSEKYLRATMRYGDISIPVLRACGAGIRCARDRI